MTLSGLGSVLGSRTEIWVAGQKYVSAGIFAFGTRAGVGRDRGPQVLCHSTGSSPAGTTQISSGMYCPSVSEGSGAARPALWRPLPGAHFYYKSTHAK
jgi:hypothetical protein